MKSIIKNSSAIAFVGALAMLAACSDPENKNISGGITEDKGIVANLNVAGVTQKGPFVKGSAVTVQGIDCETLKFTDEVFEGEVKSDKGDFTVEDITLKSTCALFEVTGVYRNEISGNKSSEKLTLHALTDLKDRKNVNINVLTELEYERLMNLVTEKDKKFAEAKAQAEEEVLAAFDIKGSFEEFENLNIFESGDENAALLAVSVMMQAETDDAGLANRLDKFADSFAETGKWKDSGTKKTISEWAIEVTANGGLDSIRKNVEGWGLGDVPAFEKFIEAYADGDSVVLIVTPNSSSRDTTYNAEKNTLTDTRDGQVYRTVTIGDQVWMAENLNYKTDSSFCYNDSSKYCDKYGRLYIWDAAMDACPEGWRLPDETDFVNLIKAVGGEKGAGTKLKSTSGWNDDDGESGNGTDAFGFSALAAGISNAGYYGVGYTTSFWGSTECGSEGVPETGNGCAYAMWLDYDDVNVNLRSYAAKDLGYSVRCVKLDNGTAPESSSSSITSSSSRSDNRTVSYKMTRPIAFLDTVNRRYYYVDDHCAYDRDNDKYKWVQGDAPKGIVSYDLDDYAVGGQPGGIYFLGYKISNDTLYKCHVYTNSCDEPNYANVYVGNSGSFLGTWKSVSQLPSGLLRSVTNRDVKLTVSPESFTFQVSYTVPPFYYTSEHCTLIYYITGDNDFNTKCLAIFKNANYPNTDIADTVHVTDDIWIAKKGVDGVVTSINGKIIESRFSYAFDPDTYKEELYRTTNYNGIECSYNSKMIEVVKSKELCEELDPDVYNHDDKFEYSNFSEFESCYSQYGFM